MAEQSQASSSMTPQKTSIKIGDSTYEIDISQIPYLSSFVNFQTKAQPQSPELIHGPIPLFDIALKGLTSGYRQCFRSLSPSLSEHRTLCETYEFLCIDVLSSQTLTEIIHDIKAGKTDYERGYKRSRDAAFKLVYLILLGEFGDEKKDAAKVYNAVLYVVSHSGTFKRRTRRVVREAFQERFVCSAKQATALDKWRKENDDVVLESVIDEGDVTTEAEEEYYDSDDS